jgi:hypothetical protein
VSLSRIALVLAAGFVLSPYAFSARSAHARTGDDCVRAASPTPGRLLAESGGGTIALDGGLRTVPLKPVCTDDRRDLSLSQKVMSAPPHRRVLLVVEDLRAARQPGVLFDLRLGGDKSGDRADRLLGTLNFYSAQRPGVTARARIVSYDVTRALQTLAIAGWLGDGLVLTIAAHGTPASGSHAAIGRIVLIEQ